MPIILQTGLAVLASLPASALAEPIEAVDAGGVIIVSALRTPTPVDTVASSLTVIDKRAIDASQAPVVSDLLVRTPGISFTRNGGYGTATSIRIRGAEGDQTVLVIDGVKLADPSSTGGGYNFATLMTGDIDQIEILRGPQSILWGSQAIGGVVNIVTATPDRALEASADIEAGSRDTVNARAAVGGRSGPVHWRVAGGRFTTEGISAISPRFGGKERDGYTNSTLNGRVGIALSPGISVDLRGYYAKGRADIDSAGSVPDSPEYSLVEEWTGYAGLNADLFDGALRNRLSFSRSETVRDNSNPLRTVRPQSFAAKGQTDRYEYQGTLGLAQGWTIVFGIEREEQKMRSASPPNSLASFTTIRVSADIDSQYAQVRIEPVVGLTLNGGLRHDHHSAFGGNMVFGGGAVWSLFDDRTILRASYGEGFKAPTLYQLHSEYGNSALDPEKSRGWDAGVEQHLFYHKLILSATWFERNTDNLITYNGCPTSNRPPLCLAPGTTTPRAGYYANIQRSEAHGLEMAGLAQIGRLTIDGNYSWIVSEDRSPGLNFGNQLARRPRHAANATASYAWPFGLNTAVAMRWSGKTIDTAQTSATVTPFVNRAYTLVDLRAEMPVTPTLTLFARAENLFDDYYETARRYGQLGRSIYAGFRARL